MVQLVRITTQDTTGLFENTFNEDITIEKNSKVALHSMTCEISTQQITIDAQNDTLFSKLAGGNSASAYKESHLEHNTYTSANFEGLLKDAETKLNSVSAYRTSDIGLQWEAELNTHKKVVFNVKLGKYVQPISTDPEIMALVGYKNVSKSTPLATSYMRNGGGNLTNDAFIWFNSPNCKGACSFSAKMTVGSQKGFQIAYLAAPPNATTATIQPEDIMHGIRLVGTQSANPDGVIPTYVTYLNGITNVSNVVALVNDYLSIDTGQGKIVGNIYRANLNDPIELFSYDYDHTTDLFPVVIFSGDETVRVGGIKYNSDPVYNVVNTMKIKPIDESVGVPIPKYAQNASIKELKFGDIDLALILGFKQTSNYSNGAVIECSFVSDKSFTMADLADSFVLELLNIPLDSYDGLTNQRRNILHTIVQTDAIRERLTYTAPYPLYIDMKNAHRISLREIRARILREDLTQVTLNGFSQLTLLISE